MLGDEPEAQGEEADDMAHGLVGRLSRRNRDAPDRFDPSLDSALSAGYHPPGAAGAAAHADPRAERQRIRQQRQLQRL